MNKPYIIVHMMTSVDEISILIGAGVDGRTGQPSLFDNRTESSRPIALQLKDVENYEDGAVWL